LIARSPRLRQETPTTQKSGRAKIPGGDNIQTSFLFAFWI